MCQDYYICSDYVCKIHSPYLMYFQWGMCWLMVALTIGPLFHSNYYFGGRFLPKDQGNTQLCEDSW